MKTIGRRLFILLEGSEDERFFRSVLLPLLQKKYSAIQFWKYATKTKGEIGNFVNVIGKMGADYIFVADQDKDSIRLSQEFITQKYPAVQAERLQIVSPEIESWYLAGLEKETHLGLGLGKFPPYTDGVTKEDFMGCLPRKISKLEMLLEILACYQLEVGRRRNRSLDYFVTNFVESQ